MKWISDHGGSQSGGAVDRTIYLLFDAGADLEIEAADGASAWLLLQSQQKENPHPLREQLILDLSE